MTTSDSGSDSGFSRGLELRSRRLDDVLTDDLPVPPDDADAPHWSRSVVALEQGDLVGVGWISLDPVTETYLVEVHVRPGQRRRGVGTALVAALADRTDEPFPVCGRTMTSQPWRRAFAEALGCIIRTRCPEPWLDPTSAFGRAWAQRQPVPPGYAVDPLADVPVVSVLDAWVAYFSWSHRPFAEVRESRVRDAWKSYAAHLDPQASMIATDASGEVVAFSLVTPDGWQGRTFVVSETADPEQPDGDALLRATVAASVVVLARRGVTLVELEGHATDAHSPALLRSLPPGGGDPMEIVELRRPVRATVADDRQRVTV